MLFTSYWYDFDIEPTPDKGAFSEVHNVCGPLCRQIDIVGENLRLPSLEKGESVVIHPVGAYNNTQWMQFIQLRPRVVMTFSMVFAAAAGLGKLPPAGAPAAAALAVPGHPFLEVLLKSVGPAFFQVNIISGAVVVPAMLVFSRLGFLLGLAGLASGYITHLLLGASPQVLTEQYLGFNYFLIGIALGGIFFVPSLGTLILVVLSSSAAALLTLSAGILLPGHLPPTAIPFNVVTLLVLYALKLRLFPSDILALSTAEVSSRSLRRRRERSSSCGSPPRRSDGPLPVREFSDRQRRRKVLPFPRGGRGGRNRLQPRAGSRRRRFVPLFLHPGSRLHGPKRRGGAGARDVVHSARFT